MSNSNSNSNVIKLPPIFLPPAQSRAQEAFMEIGKHLINHHPDIVIKNAEKIQEKRETAPEKVQLPVISLKGLIQAQKEQFAERFEQKKENNKTVCDSELGTSEHLSRNRSQDNDNSNNENEINEFIEDDKFITNSNSTHSQFEFDQSQEDARKGILQEQFSCLIGAAGTGKTKTLNDILEDIKSNLGMVNFKERQQDGTIKTVQKLSIVFCAFTGRAVEQMKNKLPKEYHNVCGTIHGDKVLTYVPELYDDIDEEGNVKTKMRFIPTYNAYNKLPYDVYVIDEAGMLSVELWNILREAMIPTAKVILVGDINQLPPVYGRSILGYAMLKWPVFELTKIHRQAADNPIIANAHRILQGIPPISVRGKFDMDDLKDAGSNKTQERVIAVLRYLQRKNEFDPMIDTCIVPQNVSALGKDNLNELILSFFNPTTEKNPRYLIRTGIAIVHFSVGDKVMMLNNDKNNNLTNGQIGRITNISLNGQYKNIAGMVKQSELEAMKNIEHDGSDFSLDIEEADRVEYSTEGAKKENELSQRQASHIVSVDFGTGKEITFATAGEFRAITHAYIITCHKSQGGEYPTVVIVVHSANNKLLSREWLYTAVTRARERIVLMFNQRGLGQCLQRQRVKGLTLQEKIASFMKMSEEDAVRDNPIIPNLPERRSI